MTMSRRDKLDIANISISAASLGVGIAALCLNEKKEDTMDNTERYHLAKSRSRDEGKGKKALKREARAKKQSKQNMIREYANSIDYSGPIIMPNEKGRFQDYGTPKEQERSWVAMEVNSRTGGDRQAVVCSSKEEARQRAVCMRNAHRKGSKQSKDCIQGYARIDTSTTIDVPAELSKQTAYRV